jgi:GMP synthase (glutamine-hydrolysing)
LPLKNTGKTKILVINNRSESLDELLSLLNILRVNVEVKPPLEDLSFNSYDGLIVSGGYLPRAEYRQILEWYCKLFEAVTIPVLAICLGLRILGYCNGSRVRRIKPSELGVTKIFFFKEYPLAPGVRELLVFENHDYELLDLKAPLENYASSERCKIQAVKHGFKPIFAVQFHPEISKENNGPLIIRNFIDFCRSFKG